MILYLVRHGETTYNRDGLALGQADAPLTETGHRQVGAVVARLSAEPLERILSSPLSRALTLANAIAGERATLVEARPELIELDVGSTEGTTFTDMRQRHAELLREWAGPEGHRTTMPGGESLADLDRRLAPLMEELLAEPWEAVAVVSHNFVLRVMLCRLLGMELSAFRTMSVDLASISSLVVRNERVTIRSINDCCHLDHA